ncbi:shikimate dehydrogenase [Sinimarinibacterium sp. NLF-5-8]|uniref:shikimate dehydrogenase n=1 Tax=Sinimarinibacterium sp. NLF-5-8 TaxID=2698684 RepID=UPI00137BEC49|nr:shikimate dehydrogenase [Sinimarinibacterium sp. NLF-5-8]QHS10476.1 shikimate dehydrogenase [Sinimarinibacterium sp. NLF-5-8]
MTPPAADRYAVIGQPIAHSRSPFIHARFAAQTGQALTYEALEIAPADLRARLTQLHAQGYCGLNATLPHKIEALALCESLTARAQNAGAANTLVRTAHGWHGDNTDGQGCLLDLQRLGFAVRAQRVLILGAGGAVRGILEPLLGEKPALLAIANRSPEKPAQLARDFAALGAIQPCTFESLQNTGFDLVINATSAGHSGAFIPLSAGVLRRHGNAYDLSYGHAFTPFAAWARAQEAANISDGLGMLVGQAAAAFALWRGVRPDIAPVLAALRA